MSKLLCAVMIATCAVCGGCKTFKETFGSLTPRPFAGYRDASEEGGDQWANDVGETARGDRPREKDPDDWWGRLMMSRKARDIERSVGVGW